MLAHLIALWDRVRESLWALPLTIAAACAGLAIAALKVDLPWASDVAWLYSGSGSQAPEFAASLAGAMITLTTLAFSITMVVLTLAAQQLGPRIIQIFMQDRGTQAALGLFIGAIVYLLLVLRALDGDNEGHAPNLAITGGTALVLASVVGLLFFVHSLARSIVSDTVIARIGARLDDALTDAFPKREDDTDCAEPPEGGAEISLKRCGYVQRIDYQALARAAAQCNATIVLTYRAGAHIINGESDARIHGGHADEIEHALQRAVVISSERSAGQDPEWSAHQMVEIALRALSPGINDEYTALAVINRLSGALALAARRAPARNVWRDEDGKARVYGPAPNLAELTAAAFDQIREAGASKQRVLLGLAHNLAKLSTRARGDFRDEVARQALLLERAAERGIAEPMEREPILAVTRELHSAPLTATQKRAHA